MGNAVKAVAPNKNPAIRTIDDADAVDADADGSGACGRLEGRRLLLHRLLIFAILFFVIQKSSGYGESKTILLVTVEYQDQTLWRITSLFSTKRRNQNSSDSFTY